MLSIFFLAKKISPPILFSWYCFPEKEQSRDNRTTKPLLLHMLFWQCNFDIFPIKYWGLCPPPAPLNLSRTLWLSWPKEYDETVTMQLPKLQHKHVTHFRILCWGHSLLESSCHTTLKPKLTKVKRSMERLHVDIFAKHSGAVSANN